MKISDTISGIPKSILTFGTLLIILLSYSYWAGELTRELQIIIFGLLGLMIVLGIRSDSRKIISLDDAKLIGSNYIKSKTGLGILADGELKEGLEGTLRYRQGVPWYYDVSIIATNPSRTNYIVSIDPYSGKVISSTEKDSWKVEESPNVEIVTPPDIISWMKQKRSIEKELEDRTK